MSRPHNYHSAESRCNRVHFAEIADEAHESLSYTFIIVKFRCTIFVIVACVQLLMQFLPDPSYFASISQEDIKHPPNCTPRWLSIRTNFGHLVAFLTACLHVGE